jgi:hypothetical protein
VVEMTPRGLAADKLYVSAASGLVLRLEMPSYLGEGLIATVIIDFSDEPLDPKMFEVTTGR